MNGGIVRHAEAKLAHLLRWAEAHRERTGHEAVRLYQREDWQYLECDEPGCPEMTSVDLTR